MVSRTAGSASASSSTRRSASRSPPPSPPCSRRYSTASSSATTSSLASASESTRSAAARSASSPLSAGDGGSDGPGVPGGATRSATGGSAAASAARRGFAVGDRDGGDASRLPRGSRRRRRRSSSSSVESDPVVSSRRSGITSASLPPSAADDRLAAAPRGRRRGCASGRAPTRDHCAGTEGRAPLEAESGAPGRARGVPLAAAGPGAPIECVAPPPAAIESGSANKRRACSRQTQFKRGLRRDASRRFGRGGCAPSGTALGHLAASRSRRAPASLASALGRRSETADGGRSRLESARLDMGTTAACGTVAVGSVRTQYGHFAQRTLASAHVRGSTLASTPSRSSALLYLH